MQTTSASAQSAMGNTVTTPIVLVEIGFSTVLRYSSYGDVTWNSLSWIGGRLSNGSVEIKSIKNGSKEIKVFLNNMDNAISSVILTEGGTGKTIKAWELYGSSPYAANDATQIFDGITDGTPDMGDVLQINGISDGAFLWTPRVTATYERFPHMIRPGTVVTWGNEKFTVEKDPES